MMYTSSVHRHPTAGCLADTSHTSFTPGFRAGGLKKSICRIHTACRVPHFFLKTCLCSLFLEKVHGAPMSRVHRNKRLDADAHAKMEAMKAIPEEERAR